MFCVYGSFVASGFALAVVCYLPSDVTMLKTAGKSANLLLFNWENTPPIPESRTVIDLSSQIRPHPCLCSSVHVQDCLWAAWTQEEPAATPVWLSVSELHNHLHRSDSMRSWSKTPATPPGKAFQIKEGKSEGDRGGWLL